MIPPRHRAFTKFSIAKLISFLLAMNCITIVSAQKVTISAINENRSTTDSYFGNRCEVVLKVSGDEVRKYKNARIGSITKAVDQAGFDLIPEDFNSSVSDLTGNPSEVTMVLNPTSRKSEVIADLQGELILLGPTEQNGGIIKNEVTKLKGIKNIIPSSADVSLVYINKDVLEMLKLEDESKREKEIKTAAGTSKKQAEDLLKVVDEYAYLAWVDDQAIFFCNGNTSKIIDVQLQKKDGTMLDNNGSMQSGNQSVYYFSENIEPTSKIVVFYESEKSVKKLPFKFSNIDLP